MRRCLGWIRVGDLARLFRSIISKCFQKMNSQQCEMLLELFPKLLRVGVVGVRLQRFPRLLEALLKVTRLEGQQRVVVEGLKRVLRHLRAGHEV